MIKEYYGNDYFEWQKKSGLLTAKLSTFKFSKYIEKEKKVLEFGCGGGFLLDKLDVRQKKGVEVNPFALQSCLAKGLDVVTNLDEIPDNWADVVISNHVLEHVENPIQELKKIMMKMKHGGIIIFVVPNEKKAKYDTNDINKHLYTWTELNLGNLFNAAGYHLIEVLEVKHRWFPFIGKFIDLFGLAATHFVCRIYGFLFNDLSQIKIVARKK
ncbi:MAG: class I SAM-dependent methyltransferase [Cytophagia bacterium]|nr:MAG: class I SAM-dependent methyltransferase [Cytophagales bacterium]TAG38195.1 MAG: class I SAM-dependent methyltransferase [Cytophagia bacterium]